MHALYDDIHDMPKFMIKHHDLSSGTINHRKLVDLKSAATATKNHPPFFSPPPGNHAFGGSFGQVMVFTIGAMGSYMVDI